MTKKNWWRKAAGLIGVVAGALILVLLVGRGSGSSEGATVSEMNDARDLAQILSLFERNRYWLTATPNFPAEFSFRTRSPNEYPAYRGALTVKVLRDNGNLFGFVSYYMKAPGEGYILFLGVDEKYRGKRYADQLMLHAMEDLIGRGVRRIELITRPTNIAAQKVYRRLGFREVWRDHMFVDFEYP